MRIPEPYFKNIPIIGDLSMDIVLFAYDYPILFVCRTQEERYYLCNCCDTYKEQRWLIAPILLDDLEKLLNNRITIREVFQKAIGQCCVATWCKGDLQETYRIINAEDFEQDDLPDEGEYLDAELDEYKDYLESVYKRTDDQISNVTTRHCFFEKQGYDEYNGLQYVSLETRISAYSQFNETSSDNRITMSEKNYKNSSVMWYSTKVIRDSREYNQNNLMLTNSTYLSNVKSVSSAA